jgi:hypothetical protein
MSVLVEFDARSGAPALFDRFADRDVAHTILGRPRRTRAILDQRSEMLGLVQVVVRSANVEPTLLGRPPRVAAKRGTWSPNAGGTRAAVRSSLLRRR